MQQTSRIEVDLGAVERNVAVVRRACARAAGADDGHPSGAEARTTRSAAAASGTGIGPGVGLCAVLKADGYGLGAIELAQWLERRCAAEMVAVYSAGDAERLTEAGVTTPILVLMPVETVSFDGAMHQAVRAGRVHFVLHNDDQLRALSAGAALLGAPGTMRLPVHVEVDTGMSRGGCAPELARRLVERVGRDERLTLAGVFSHFASADRDDVFTLEQAARFDAWLSDCGGLIPRGCAVHLANSFGVFRSARHHRDMVRVGLALLGYLPEEARDAERFALLGLAAELTPAVRWLTRITHVTRIAPGTSVGYGGRWVARRATRLGLAPVGYADGYPLSLSGRNSPAGVEAPPGGVVRVRTISGRMAEAPVVGAVSMDQITIDLTDIAETQAGLSSEVEVIGVDKGAATHLPEVARRAGTMSHELLCRLSPRTPRKYVVSAGVVGRGEQRGDARRAEMS